MLSVVENQRLKWLVTTQAILVILTIISVIFTERIRKSKRVVSTSQSWASLETVRAVMIWSIREIFLFWTQSRQFTTTMNACNRFPMTNSRRQMAISMLLMIAAITWKRSTQCLLLTLHSSKMIFLFAKWKIRKSLSLESHTFHAQLGEIQDISVSGFIVFLVKILHLPLYPIWAVDTLCTITWSLLQLVLKKC